MSDQKTAPTVIKTFANAVKNEAYSEILHLLSEALSAEDLLRSNPDRLKSEIFSPQRSNVFAWYPFKNSSNILIIGDECGAASGLLLEKAAKLTAITECEESADIFAARFKDAGNLTIYAGNITDTVNSIEEKFDYIILMPDYAMPEMLNLAKGLLKSTGVMLIVAVNPLGVKYLRGVSYHGGRRAELPIKMGKEFSKGYWQEILNEWETGYKFYYPHPDYTYADEIFTDSHLPEPEALSDCEPLFEGDLLSIFDNSQLYSRMSAEEFPQYANSYIIEVSENLSNIEYAKVSRERNKDKRVCTIICRDENSLTVKKIPAEMAAQNHIENMDKSYSLLTLQCEDKGIDICECSYNAPEIIFKFIKGKPLSSLINEAVENGDEAALMGNINTLKNIVNTLSDQKPFQKSKEFTEYFGEMELPEDFKNAAVANIDLIAENIIMAEKPTVIDYEWVLPFTVPVEFIVFRSLYHNKAISTLDKELLNRVYEFSGLKEEWLPVLKQMESKFQKNISGNTLKYSQIARAVAPLNCNFNDIDIKKSTFNAKIYNYDNPFEVYTLLSAVTQDITLTADLSGESPKTIAIEPASAGAIVKIKGITAKRGKDEVAVASVSSNADLIIGDDHYFTGNPCIYFENDEYTGVTVKYFVYNFGDTFVANTVNLIKENGKLKEKLSTYEKQSEKMDATIVIPTKNGGEQLRTVLSAVFSQKTEYNFEVICVDSGSSDNTLEIIKGFPCKLYTISPKDFGHGRTRNFGAFKGTGEFILFITQDALPATEFWLQNFVDAMKTDDEIVGGFGIHYPYPDCNIFDKRDIELHFRGFGTENTVFTLEDRERYEREEGYRHFLAFFSDNNSCVRRSVFEKYPYDDVNFAEDQIWARKMIEAGYKKLYCALAPVYHSHNYSLSTYFKRYYDEFKSLYELHGFIIVKHWYLTVPAAIKHIIADVKYLRTLNISKKSKLYWAYYSLVRNLYRYIGGFIGGMYHTYSDKTKARLDKMFSQQYRQKKN